MRSKLAPLATLAVAALGLGLAGCAAGGSGDGDTTKIVLGTWRTEDAAMWENDIIPAFEQSHPGITVEYAPVDTNDYNAAIQSQIEGGTGPDVIMCRPFDVNRSWIEQGYFDSLAELDAISTFPESALTAWEGDDGTPYCVPVASVLAGFYYNTAIFDELGLEVPTTQAEFIDVLDAIKEDGTYTPLALGSADGWQLAYNMLYQVGPNAWHGEDGRLGLIDGTKKLTDPDFVEGFRVFDSFKDYLPKGYESISYEDMTQLFTLGQAAILPDGSWQISQVTSTGLDVGVFGAPPAAAGDQRYQQEMADMAFGLNAAGKQKEAATEFLEWLGTPEFQQLYVNKLPGFFSMGSEPVSYDDPLAQEFADLKEGAELTSRLALDRLSAGQPPLDDEIWRVAQLMYNSGLSPEEATAELQKGLDSWYTPAG
ncbi:ABC transporter substrate-binding protein [Agromyces mediolanus]|uniref:Probable sugar-binding periplasmic protein n=1 Tax=Agromyces mediolanus TaxID=41986 RepID=A0A918FC24_AGRME|nr:ABC transporter substrate-binding protein [Agromyces mediolanus]GGR20525.1 sugar ABC transporter substrate-binding protein [Agromyces mediolanus]GLJ73234.1 sugar ABC transporter substrate-binding protein [Agromyces mediolanus]